GVDQSGKMRSGPRFRGPFFFRGASAPCRHWKGRPIRGRSILSAAEAFYGPDASQRADMRFSKDIADLCKEHGLRLTGPRKVIMQVLAESTDHPDAVELHRRVSEISPGVAIATVYRTLSLLEEKGV